MKQFRLKNIVLLLAPLGFVAISSTVVLANPEGGTVAAGNVTIQQESPTKLGIIQSSDKAIVDWQKFSIAPNEQTQIYMPSASSVILNRVVGQDPSAILGRLTANGQVFLVNPNGIFFGKGSQIDVAGLVASTHNIRNADFLAGHYLFNIPGKPGAAVINEGMIRVSDTGIAAFIAPSVQNKGVVVAKLGKIVLAAANGFTLDFYGDELINFLVADEVAKTAFDRDGKPLTSFVENSGRIEAQGGYVLLTAKAAENAIHSVINQSGVIEATTVGTQKGEIILQAGKGSLAVSGELNASAPKGGDGGFIDTSGSHVSIDPKTKISTFAPFGTTGHWLLDPTDYTIAASGGDITGAALADYLGLSNVEVKTVATGSGNGDIFVNDGVTWGGYNKLTLTAQRNVYVNQALNATGGASVKLRADSEGTGVGTAIFSGNGHISVTNGGAAGIYYNPMSYTDAASKSDSSGNPYTGVVTDNTGNKFTAYMLINDVNQLQGMSNNLTGKYALGKNIDASSLNFTPVGNSATPFQGTLNGIGYAIDNLKVSVSGSGTLTGLFGKLDGAKITNLTLTNANIYNYFGSSGVGGIAGYAINSVIDKSFFSGSVSGFANVGGLVGTLGEGGTITNSINTGEIAGKADTGGLVGWTQPNSLIENSLSTGKLINNGIVIIGSTSGVLPPTFGGLVGDSTGGMVTNSYWNTETSGQTTSAGGTGLTTAQMGQQSSFSGLDFSNTWEILPGATHPTLKTASSQAVKVLTPTGNTTPPTTLTPAQELLVQQHKNDSTFALLLAISEGLFTNDSKDPVWVAMYQNGAATAVQIEANRLRNIYDAYTPADLLAKIISKELQNDPNNNNWRVIYRNNHALDSQVKADAMSHVYYQYDKRPGTTLFSGILKGDLSNTSTDPVLQGVWHELVVHNLPETNKASYMMTLYITYKTADTQTLVSALKSDQLVYNDTLWQALALINANMTAAYDLFTGGTITPPTTTLTPAQQLLVQQHKDDSTFALLIAISKGLFTNDKKDPIWVAMYDATGHATPTQNAADKLRNEYDAYTPADVLAKIINKELINDPTNNTWWIMYRNGHALDSQVKANDMSHVYYQYDKRPGTTLFNGILNGDLSNTSTTPALHDVWHELVVHNLSETNKASAMLATYNTYKGEQNVQTLVGALKNKQLDYDNDVWKALTGVNAANIAEAYRFFLADGMIGTVGGGKTEPQLGTVTNANSSTSNVSGTPSVNPPPVVKLTGNNQSTEAANSKTEDVIKKALEAANINYISTYNPQVVNLFGRNIEVERVNGLLIPKEYKDNTVFQMVNADGSPLTQNDIVASYKLLEKVKEEKSTLDKSISDDEKLILKNEITIKNLQEQQDAAIPKLYNDMALGEHNTAFVLKYFGDSTHRPITLSEIELDNRYQNTPSVIKATQSFEERVKSQALKSPFSDFQIDEKSTTDVTWDYKLQLFSIGGSTFFESATCHGSQCTLTYSINDSFKDPLDMKKVIGKEFDFGYKYPITHRWTKQINFDSK
jgi:filamentous hemagglutinin family protein